MTQKKTNAEGEVQNNTGTELDILANIERSYYKANPNAQKRNTARSLKWFSKFIPKNYNRVRTARMMRDRDMWADSIRPGSLYMFEYKAKHRDTLPVWDAFPLVFFFDTFTAKDGSKMLLGINMHYLPPSLRYTAFTSLLKLRNQKRYRENTRLKISWGVLKSLANSKFFEHSVKMYRMDHVQSKFIQVPPRSWELVMWLPLARWQKGSQSEAWKIK